MLKAKKKEQEKADNEEKRKQALNTKEETVKISDEKISPNVKINFIFFQQLKK